MQQTVSSLVHAWSSHPFSRGKNERKKKKPQENDGSDGGRTMKRRMAYRFAGNLPEPAIGRASRDQTTTFGLFLGWRIWPFRARRAETTYGSFFRCNVVSLSSMDRAARIYARTLRQSVASTSASSSVASSSRCRCQIPSFRRFASTSALPAQDTLVLAARKLVKQVEDSFDGGIEANKRKREIEGLQRALLDVEEGEEVSIVPLSRPITHMERRS